MMVPHLNAHQQHLHTQMAIQHLAAAHMYAQHQRHLQLQQQQHEQHQAMLRSAHQQELQMQRALELQEWLHNKSGSVSCVRADDSLAPRTAPSSPDFVFNTPFKPFCTPMSTTSSHSARASPFDAGVRSTPIPFPGHACDMALPMEAALPRTLCFDIVNDLLSSDDDTCGVSNATSELPNILRDFQQSFDSSRSSSAIDADSPSEAGLLDDTRLPMFKQAMVLSPDRA